MADRRKLQAEIDRTLKKIEEGVEVFDRIFDKVTEAENQSLKEKHEAELKKEIKKLQRFRDQVKQWAGSNDVKDKNPLLEARRTIEREMERFKVVEKETKTKAFSKEGLARAASSKDPKEKAREDARDWLNRATDGLNEQMEAFEAEVETISSEKKGKKSAKSNPRLGHLEESIQRHLQHVARLELVLRLIDNEALAPEDAEDLKDLIEDYLERNQDDFDEFADPEEMYEDLNLDELDEIKQMAHEVAHSAPTVVEKVIEKVEAAESKKEGGDAGGGGGGGGDSNANATAAAAASAKTAAKPPKTPEKTLPTPVLGGDKKLPAPLGLSTAGPQSQGGGGEGGAVKVLPGPKGREGTLGGNGGSWGAPGGAGGAGANGGKGEGGIQTQQSWSFPSGGGGGGGDPPVYAAPPAQQSQSVGGGKIPPPLQPGQRPGSSKPSPGSPAGSATSPQGGGKLPAPLVFPLPGSGSGGKTAAAPSGGSGGASGGGASGGASGAAAAPAPERVATGDDVFDLPTGLADLADPGAGGEGVGRTGGCDAFGGAALDAFGGAASSSSSNSSDKKSSDKASPSDRGPGVLLGGVVHRDAAVNLRLLESSYRNLPQPGDGVWTRRRRERPPAPTPASYPAREPPVLENPALFERLDADALFFTFYYQQGTSQQYLAARELKRANWRFHKKHATWFARQEEPKRSTEEYEQGSYIYFDFAMSGGPGGDGSKGGGAPGGWCQRSKADFMFEYSQLESEMQ